MEEDFITGQALKALRERNGVTLSEIADQTRININYLEFMEANSYSSLPAPVYVVGYLKQYARIAGLDNQVVDGYMRGYQKWLDTSKKRDRF
jgi:cytoskeleton protein RodZ